MRQSSNKRKVTNVPVQVGQVPWREADFPQVTCSRHESATKTCGFLAVAEPECDAKMSLGRATVSELIAAEEARSWLINLGSRLRCLIPRMHNLELPPGP